MSAHTELPATGATTSLVAAVAAVAIGAGALLRRAATAGARRSTR